VPAILQALDTVHAERRAAGHSANIGSSEPLLRAVVKLGGAWALARRHFLRVIEHWVLTTCFNPCTAPIAGLIDTLGR
jgi:hypothetical protein